MREPALNRMTFAALAATNEVKVLGFNLNSRRSEEWSPKVAERLEAIRDAHADLGTPQQAGQGIALSRR